MNKLRLMTVTFVIGLLLSTVSFSSDPGAYPGKVLVARGYELTVEGLRVAFVDEDQRAIRYILEYVSKQENREPFFPLVDDIKRSLNNLDATNTYGRALYIGCLFAIDTGMTREEEKVYLERLRHQVFETEIRSPAIRALIAAHEHRNVDIKADLYRVSKLGIVSRDGHADFSSFCVKELFRLYGESLIAQEVESLRLVWEFHPKMHNVVVEQAQRKGFLLDFHFKENDERRKDEVSC